MKLGKDESAESQEDQPSEETSSETPNEQPSEEPPAEDKKEKTEELRRVIKVNPDQKEEEQQPKTEEPPAPETEVPDETPSESPPAGGEGGDLTQKRELLQNMKDFDFQIKRNQEDINVIKEKIDTLSKDLDDLVSLYEIVSEQMNPFVGLSNVTKKRIEALETFTKEMEEIKNRMNEIEYSIGREGVQPATPSSTEKPIPETMVKPPIQEKKPKEKVEEKKEEPPREQPLEAEPQVPDEKSTDKPLTPPDQTMKTPEPTTPETPNPEPLTPIAPEKTEMPSMPVTPTEQTTALESNMPVDNLDALLTQALDAMMKEQQMDMIIDEFISKL